MSFKFLHIKTDYQTNIIVCSFTPLKIDIDGLSDMPPKTSRKCCGIYDVELIVDQNHNNEIELKVFFDPLEYLGEKISAWSHSKKPSNLLDYFCVLETMGSDSFIGIEFVNYRIKGMTNSTKFYESNLKYFKMKLTGIRKIYDCKDQDISEARLNHQSFDLVELNYRYNTNFPWHQEYSWQPQNQVSAHFKFGNIFFKPEHRIYTLSNSDEVEVTIKKDPRLAIKHDNINQNDILRHINLLCTLYSFYSLQNIDYGLARIYTESKLFIEIRDVNSSRVKDAHGLFRWDFFQDPMNLIQNVNVTFLIENLDFFQKIVQRFIYCFDTVGESRFMILYSILEQIRNQYILEKRIELEKAGEQPNLKKVVEEFNFTPSKRKTDEFIKEKIQEISSIVSNEDKEKFKDEAKYKITPIKVISMINQFQSLFDYIDIDPAEYELNFREIKALRDSIFHGRPIDENLQLLNDVNKYSRLPRFVGIVILKYAGINDLKAITKVEY